MQHPNWPLSVGINAMESSGKIPSFHFIGIGGIGMSGLAKLCLDRGWKVQGSDPIDNARTQELCALGATVFSEHSPDLLNRPIDFVIHSSAIGKDHPELMEATAQNLPLFHRSMLLKNLLVSTRNLAVSGTHGKTTTTSLLGHVLTCAHYDPLIISGGIMHGLKCTIRHGKGNWAVVEADESDKSHLNFDHLEGAIATNLEAEHLENYGTFQNLLDSFQSFLSMPSGFSIFCGEDETLRDLPACKHSKALSYGMTSSCSVMASAVRADLNGMRFTLHGLGDPWEDVQLALHGRHNVLNAMAVILAAHSIGISQAHIRAALASFQGVERRLTLKGTYAGKPIFDDYAHHPTEIKAVLATLRDMGFSKILVLCQPHRYTRLRDCFEAFSRCFDAAKKVFLWPVYGANEAPIFGITSEALSESLNARGVQAEAIKWLKEDAWRILEQEEHDVVVCMGAGSITHVAESLACEKKM
jgi:UDP-N-acetylmuramate--alanine ligase